MFYGVIPEFHQKVFDDTMCALQYLYSKVCRMEIKRESGGQLARYRTAILPDISKRRAGLVKSDAVSVRRRQFLREGIRILGIGVVYFFWVCITGVGIPCPFRLLTGYLCPGCGITHYCIALLQFRFADAYSANPFLFVLMPFFIPYGIYRAHRVIQTGRTEYSRAEIGLLLVTLVGVIVFAVYRNL